MAGRAEELPFQAGFFDLLTASLTFHWVDGGRFLSEALRVLGRTGLLVIYDSFFAGRSKKDEDDGMSRWMREVYWERYPYPPRLPMDFTPGEPIEPGFRCESRDEYRNLAAFTRERLVDYLVTQTNVIAAVEEGDEDIEEVRAWLLCELAPFFEDRKSRSFVFEGPVWILRREEGDECAAREAPETEHMRIRQATEVDASAIEEIHSRAIQAIDRSFYSDTEIASWSGRVNPIGKQSFSEVLVTSICLVAEQEGRLVGFAQLAAEKGEVRAVYVLPESGGQGIGGLLLARIEAIARELKIEELELKSSLNAVAFYDAHGYEQLGETTHGLADGTQLRCVAMRKVMALPR